MIKGIRIGQDRYALLLFDDLVDQCLRRGCDVGIAEGGGKLRLGGRDGIGALGIERCNDVACPDRIARLFVKDNAGQGINDIVLGLPSCA